MNFLKPRYRVQTILLGLLAVCITTIGFADDSVLEVVPRSENQATSLSPDVLPYNFIVAPVDKERREVSYERVISVNGQVRTNTYLMPSGVKKDDAVEWYRQQINSLNGDLVFECDGRDCGRATIWASDIFRLHRLLSTIDQKQYYMAGFVRPKDNQILVAVYVVERGNRSVYAHVIEVLVDEEVDLGTNEDFSGMLARRGHAILNGVTPDRFGALNDDALAEVTRIADGLSVFSNRTVYVVCHVYGSRPADQLLEDSTECAEAATTAITEVADIEVVPFGAGPLMPLNGNPTSRVELIIPRLLRTE